MTMFFNQSYWVLLSHNEWLPTFEVQLYDRSGHMDPYYVPDKNSLRLPNENQTFPNVVGGIDRDGWWFIRTSRESYTPLHDYTMLHIHHVLLW